MKNIYLLILGGTVAAVVGGASFATVLHANSRNEQPPISTPTPSPSVSPQPGESNPQEPQPAPPKYPEFDRQPIQLKDEVKSGTEFYEFRQKLRQAVKERNAQFIRTVLPADDLTIGFGSPLSPEELDIDNPDAHFWKLLEKAIALGCISQTNDYLPEVEKGAKVWVCSDVNRAFANQYPPPSSTQGVDWELQHVVVAGENVNVRSQPNINGKIINVLSNEVVKVDRPELENQLQQLYDRGGDYSPLEGWTPIILPNSQEGYVYNRFAYAPLETRAIFGQVDGQWKLLHMPGGD